MKKWTRNITFDELTHLNQLQYHVNRVWIGPDEGYEYLSMKMGCRPFAWTKSPRAAYNACMKHAANRTIKPE